MRFVLAGALLMISTLAQAETVNVFAAGVLKDARAPAANFARFVRGDEGQAILAKHGFGLGDPAK